jgi:uncharacterized membrane protein
MLAPVGYEAPAPLPLLTRITRVAALGALEAASAGLAGWAWASRGLLPRYALDNSLGPHARLFVFLDMGIALAIGVAIAAAVIGRRGRAGLETLERLALRLSPLALAGWVPFLFDARLWVDRQLLFLLMAAAFGFGAWASARTVLATPPAFPGLAEAWRARRLPWAGPMVLARRRLAWAAARIDAPLAVTCVAAGAYAVYFAAITVAHHRNLGTSSFDMGLEDNLMWNLVHGGPIFRSTPFDGPTGTHLRHHATFFSYVLAPIYRLAPHPETLLVVQAALMGGAAIPLHLHARRHLAPWTATVVALVYLAYPPLHGANLYDFHYLPLGVFFLWLVLYAVEARRRALAVVAALLAISVREDVACCLAVLGVFLLLSGKAARAGVLLAAAGGGYFLIMKLAVMPHFAAGRESFVNQYAGLLPPEAHGFSGILQTVVGNPVFTETVVVEPAKLVYVLQLLVPVLFLPLARPIGLLLLLPGFLFTLLSTGYAPLSQISFQYTSYWTAFVFIGVVLQLARVRRARDASDASGPTRQRALAVGVVAATLACTYLDGAVLQHDTLRGGFQPFAIGTTPDDLARRAELAALIAQIPPDARVSASERLLPHVSGREDAYTMRFGLYDADYLLFQMPMRNDERDRVLPVLSDGTFGVVSDRTDMVLARRGEPTTGNAAVLAR